MYRNKYLVPIEAESRSSRTDLSDLILQNYLSRKTRLNVLLFLMEVEEREKFTAD